MAKHTFRKKSNKSRRKRTLRKNKKMRRKTLRRGGAGLNQSYKIGDKIKFTISGNEIRGLVNDIPREKRGWTPANDYYKIRFDSDYVVTAVMTHLKEMDTINKGEDWEKEPHASTIRMTAEVLTSLNPEKDAPQTKTIQTKYILGEPTGNISPGIYKPRDTFGASLHKDAVLMNMNDTKAIQWNKSGFRQLFLIKKIEKKNAKTLILTGIKVKDFSKFDKLELVNNDKTEDAKSIYNTLLNSMPKTPVVEQ